MSVRDVDIDWYLDVGINGEIMYRLLVCLKTRRCAISHAIYFKQQKL